MISDIYQEHEQDTWSSNGVRYQVNKILRLAKHKDVVLVPTKQLEQQVEYSMITIDGCKVCGSCYEQAKDLSQAQKSHAERVNQTDVNIPIILFCDHDRWIVVDGVHRLEKALGCNLDEIRATVISLIELESTRVPTNN